MDDTTFIKTLCKKLPSDVSNALYNEYFGRWDEIENIWAYPQNRFKPLQTYEEVIKRLLAISTFYRRVLIGFDGARDFYKTVSKSKDTLSKTETVISIGKYKLDHSEYNKLLGVQIEFGKLRDKYGIGDSFFDYFETEEFLTNCMELYKSHLMSNTKQSQTSDGSTENFPF